MSDHGPSVGQATARACRGVGVKTKPPLNSIAVEVTTKCSRRRFQLQKTPRNHDNADWSCSYSRQSPTDRRTEARTDPRRNPTRRIPTSIDMHTNLLSDRAGVRRTINLNIRIQQKEETPNMVINHTSYTRISTSKAKLHTIMSNGNEKLTRLQGNPKIDEYKYVHNGKWRTSWC